MPLAEAELRRLARPLAGCPVCDAPIHATDDDAWGCPACAELAHFPGCVAPDFTRCAYCESIGRKPVT